MSNEEKSTLFYTKSQWGSVRYRGWVLAIIWPVVIFCFIYGIASGADYYEHRACEAKAEKLGRAYQFGNWYGCQVKGDDGRFYPVDSIREPERR